MKRYTFLLLLLMGVQTAFSQTSIRMIVNEEQQECRRMMPMTCFLVQKDGAQEWELFYDRIAGFDYEPGYRYEIIVTQTRRPDPIPQDLSEYQYKLSKVISKTWMITGQEKTGNSDDVWKVGSLNGIQLNTDDVYFSFNEDSTQIAGKSGCNQFSIPVSFNRKKTKLKTKGAISTLMACDEEKMKREQDFIAAINNAKFKLSKDGDKWLWKKGRKVVFITEPFTMEKNTNERTPWDYFSGKKLNVIQLNGQNTDDLDAHFIFDKATGRFSGNNGCNQTGGAFDSDGSTIRFSETYSTKMACVDERVQEIERSINGIFATKGLTIDFAEQVMNIYDSKGTLVMMLAVSK